MYGFQGGRLDPLTSLVNFRNRDLNPTTGTWMEQDPAGYVNGGNQYQSFLSNPISNLDPNGRCCVSDPPKDYTIDIKILPAGMTPSVDKQAEDLVPMVGDVEILEAVMDAAHGIADPELKGKIAKALANSTALGKGDLEKLVEKGFNAAKQAKGNDNGWSVFTRATFKICEPSFWGISGDWVEHHTDWHKYSHGDVDNGDTYSDAWGAAQGGKEARQKLREAHGL